MTTDPGNPYGLTRFEEALWVQAGRPLGQDFRSWSALLRAAEESAARAARERDARIEAAGKVEEAASREAFLRWEVDQLDADARVTDGLLQTAAAVEAEEQADRQAWRAKVARLQQLGELM